MGSAGKCSPFSEYSQTVESYSLSLRERVRVRGNRAPNCTNKAQTFAGSGCIQGVR